MVVLVTLLGIHDFFWVAWVTPYLAEMNDLKIDYHHLSYPFHLTQKFLLHLLIPQIKKCSKDFVCL